MATAKSLTSVYEEDDNTLEKVGPKTHVAEVVYHGDKMILPTGMSLKEARDLLVRREKYLEEPMVMVEAFDVFPYDGANALETVLRKRYGWATAEPTPGFFGPTPPALVSIEVAPGEFKEVPWGSFSLPNVDGLISTQVNRDGQRVKFQVVAKVKRKDEATVTQLFAAVRAELRVNSIYRGKAVKIRFLDDEGDLLPMPVTKFIETNDVDEHMLVYSKSVTAAIETNLFTPIQRIQDCLDNGIRIKRGVLLGGIFGTGKTLAAKVASKYAVAAGVTYVYVPRADELSHAVEFAKQYQSPACVIFCEDIDRALNGERTVKMDDILNIIDGIDTKNSHIITVLTTNDLDAINPAMLRPGRLDAVIEVLPPDAQAVERLLRVYGGSTIPADADLMPVAISLQGYIPAVVAEVVHRAKLAQLRRQPKGERVSTISNDALLEAAETMQRQLGLLNRKKDEPYPTLESVMSNVVEKSLHTALNGAKEQIKAIHDNVVD